MAKELRRAGSLMAEYRIGHRSATPMSSMWKCYEEFAREEGVAPLPTCEAKVLGYIGWLAEEKDKGRCHVSGKSLPG